LDCGGHRQGFFYFHGSAYSLDMFLSPDCQYNSITAPHFLPTTFAYSDPPSDQVCNEASLISGTTFRFTLHGQTGSQYGIEFSANMVDWVAVTNVTLTSESAQCSTAIPVGSTLGFYRSFKDNVSSPAVGFCKMALQPGWTMI